MSPSTQFWSHFGTALVFSGNIVFENPVFFENMDLRWLLRPNHPHGKDRMFFEPCSFRVAVNLLCLVSTNKDDFWETKIQEKNVICMSLLIISVQVPQCYFLNPSLIYLIVFNI